MFRLLSAAATGLAVVFVFTKVVLAQACVSPAMVHDKLAQQVAGIALRDLESEDALAFVRAFNAVPPVSDLHAEAVVLARHAQSPQAVVIFFVQGCMASRAVVPTSVLDALLATLEQEA